MKLPAIPATASVAQGSRQALRLLLGLWDSLAIYLPLALMGMLALFTYWMVRIAPALNEPVQARPQVHEVDFFMRGATVKTYDQDGRLQARLSGAEMRHYADNATVEIDQPRWESIAPDGRLTQASALRALSRDDGAEAQLKGNALVVREAATPAGGPLRPREEYRSEFLHIYARDERIVSHLPVRFFIGADEFSADSFRYDHLGRTVALEGRAKARLVPRSQTARP